MAIGSVSPCGDRRRFFADQLEHSLPPVPAVEHRPCRGTHHRYFRHLRSLRMPATWRCGKPPADCGLVPVVARRILAEPLKFKDFAWHFPCPWMVKGGVPCRHLSLAFLCRPI